MQLGTEEILQLAPDEAAAKAGRGLAVAAKWQTLACDDYALWGECKGSGARPYQVQVDLAGPAFRCSCPSRKFPCKHGLGLMLLRAHQPASFVTESAPAWVSEWLAARRQRAGEQARKQAAAGAADPAAAARREAARLQRMRDGADELERWLADRLRLGLSSLQPQERIWDEIAARMVDAQLPGLAYRLRRCGRRVGRGEDWPARVLGELGRLQLLIDGFGRHDGLPPPVRRDLLAALGLPQTRDEVLAEGERLVDDWQVLGQACDEDERLWTRRVWLQGRASGRQALLLEHAHGARRFERNYVNGSCLRMSLSFYPGNHPLRAIAHDDAQPAPAGALPPSPLSAALDGLADAVAAHPWQWPQALRIDDGIPVRDSRGWWLTSAEGSLRLALHDHSGWPLLAASGGAALRLFGEWDGEALRPLSAWRDRLLWAEAVEAA